MVTKEVVAAIDAPINGAWILSRPKRTMLSRAANKNAAVSGNMRSWVRQVLVAPRQDKATIPETIDKVPRSLVTVGRSLRNDTAKMVAKSAVLLVRHEEIDAPRRSMPLKIK